MAITEIPSSMLSDFVCCYVDNNGNWNWDLFWGFLPQFILDMIGDYFPPSLVEEEESVF